MANLETLELTINANAQSASAGLDKLINSLTSLSKKVGKTVSGLKLLNGELSTLKGFKNLNLSGLETAAKKVRSSMDSVGDSVDVPETKLDALKMKLEGVTEAMGKAANKGNKLSVATKRLQQISIKKQIQKEMTKSSDLLEYDPTTNNNRVAVNKAGDGYSEEAYQQKMAAADAAYKAKREARKTEVARMRLQQKIKNNPVVKYLNEAPQASQYVKDYINQSMGIGEEVKSAKDSAAAFEEAFKQMENGTSDMSQELQNTYMSLNQFDESMVDTAKDTEESTSKFTQFKNGVKTVANEVKNLVPKFTLLNRVLRIATTMLIRTGVRALFNGAKEGLSNYYEYAKANSLEYANSLDQLSSSWETLKNQMGASIAPALSAAIPVINSIASAATVAFNALSQLIALLTGQSSWSKATNQVTEFGDAVESAGGGGSGLNETLAAFDELNVIASESSGGGGGASSAVSGMEDMFEEIYEFEGWIRDIANFVKDLVNWVSDNLGIVLATVGLIGTAILGWKLSQAFEGWLSTLGKWIAGGALIVLGVVLEYDFGTKIGNSLATGESLQWEDIVEGAAGIIAAGIGGYIIGGGVGAAVGIGISLFATIIGIDVGYKDGLDKMKWGSTSLTPEQVKKFVQGQFTFDVEAEVTLLKTKITNSSRFKSELEEQIITLSNSFNNISLGIDTSDEAFADMQTQYTEFTTRFNSWLKGEQELLTAYFQILPYGEEGAGIMSATFTADERLSNYFLNIGKQMADLYDQGLRTQWANNEKEDILALMTQIDNITSAANDYYNQKKLEMSSAELASNLTRETALDVIKQQKTEIDDTYNTMYSAAQELQNILLMRAGYARAMGLDKEADDYEAQASTIMSGFDAAYEEKMSGTLDNMKSYWVEGLRNVYSTDYDSLMTGEVKDMFINSLKWNKNDEDMVSLLIDEFMSSITSQNEATLQASELFGITGWELLGDNAKKQFYNNVYQAIGVDAVKMLKKNLKLSASEMITISGWNTFSIDQKVEFINALVDAYGASEAVEAAEQAGIDIVEVINEGMKSKSDATKKTAQNLMNTIKTEVTNPALRTAASQSITGVINGMISILGNKSIVTTTQLTMSNVRSVLSDPSLQQNSMENVVKAVAGMKTALSDPTLPTTASGNMDKTMSGIKTTVTNANLGKTGADAGKAFTNQLNDNLTVPKTGLDNIGTAVDNFVKDETNAAKGFMKDIGDETTKTVNKASDEINSLKVNIPISTTISTSILATVAITPIIEGAKVVNAVTTTAQQLFKTAKNIVTGNFQSSGGGGNESAWATDLKKAGGAYGIDRGDVFIANEAGAELVGSINGRTSVANQGQIIEGIQRGVAEANSEQNSLLRQQNDLLRSILEKDTSVRLNASAALGRITRQSMDMYANMVGG